MINESHFHPSPYVVLDAATFFVKSKFVKNTFILDPGVVWALRDLSMSYNAVAFVEKKDKSLLDIIKNQAKPDFESLGILVEGKIEELPSILEEYVSPIVFNKNLSNPHFAEVLMGTPHKALPLLRRGVSMNTIIEKYKYLDEERFKDKTLTLAVDYREALRKAKHERIRGSRLKQRIDEIGG
jgi:hypothetical protein